VPPPTEPAPIPVLPGPPPRAKGLGLEPIWFDWDKWEITPVAETTLRRNADVLLAHPDLKVVVSGYASEEGSAEYNARLSGRRAQAAIEYLESLGVPKEQMRFRVGGESAGRPYPLYRVVDFEFEPEK